MTALDRLLASLWDRFRTLNPQADQIHQLLTARGEQVINDHVAFRTFADPRVSINVLAQPFLKAGYVDRGEYEFPTKHLYAQHFEHPDPDLPRIFISELLLDRFSDELQATVQQLLDSVPVTFFEDPELCNRGRLWELDYETYERLVTESEYAGWLAAFGFCANHFTVLVNRLTTFASLEELNDFLKQQGFPLNSDGGEIKGTPEVWLEQSSTLAPCVPVDFRDGQQAIPSCYYEFARRYLLPSGELFSGFVAQSADKIFQSTDRR